MANLLETGISAGLGLFERAIRGGAIMTVDWTTLRYFDTVPAYVGITTFILSILAFIVLEKKKQIQDKRPGAYPALLGSIVLIYAVTIGYAYYTRPFTELPTITTRAELSASPNTAAPQSKWLKLDDAEKWRFAYALRTSTVADNGERLKCPFALNISSDDQWHYEPSAEGAWAELQPLLDLAWWPGSAGQASGHPHYHSGLTILIGTDSGNMLRCAASLSHLLQDKKILEVSVRVNQVTLDLAACKNECLELDFGANDVH